MTKGLTSGLTELVPSLGDGNGGGDGDGDGM